MGSGCEGDLPQSMGYPQASWLVGRLHADYYGWILTVAMGVGLLPLSMHVYSCLLLSCCHNCCRGQLAVMSDMNGRGVLSSWVVAKEAYLARE